MNGPVVPNGLCRVAVGSTSMIGAAVRQAGPEPWLLFQAKTDWNPDLTLRGLPVSGRRYKFSPTDCVHGRGI